MSKDDRDRAAARFNKAAQAADDARTGKTERDAAAKAVRDNMARLKALRLAQQEATPTRPATAAGKSRSKSGAKTKDKTAAKAPALSEWLAGRQSGGHRT